MSEQNNGYGRDGDMESEIAEILAECSSGSASPSAGSSEDISEMARRYGVDVISGKYNTRYDGGVQHPYDPMSAAAYPPDYRVVPGYGQQPIYYNVPPQQEYDENGGRIVFDADARTAQPYQPIYGYVPQQPVPQQPSDRSIPSAAERRKKQQESSSVKVLYDAQTSSKTAYEAPFENIGDKNVPLHVSDGIDRTQKKKKKSKKKTIPGEMSKSRRILKSFIPWNGDSRKEIVRKIIMDVSFFVLFFCAFYFMNYFIELTNAQKIDKITPGVEIETVDDLAQQWAAIKEKYPDVDFPEGMNIDYAELYAKNQDFVGWISINNTNIDAPVVQCSDNDYYLTHDFLKNSTKYGCSFMDYRNVPESDRNIIIYGHHMRDNMLFAQLEKYMTVEGFQESPVIIFNTLFHNYTWKVYAAFVTNDTWADDNNYMFNYIVPDFYTVNSFVTYMQAVDERKLYDTGVDINENDRILTLSTCSYEFNNARLVVIARLVRDGEDPDVDVSKAVVNENPRYPQKWYDVNGMTNPYRDAFRWEPNT